MKTIAFKLVLRSWWRNKTFSVISILSLAIGIACTNLLAVFVLHEYTIEGNNPCKERILFMSQDSPMKSGEKTSFVFGNIPPMLQEKYPEVEDFMRMERMNITHITIDETIHKPINLIRADSSFARLFPCRVLYGNLHEALTQPDKIALTEATARKLFGAGNPVGRILTVTLPHDSFGPQGEMPAFSIYQVAAVIKEREQSILNFEAITGMGTFNNPYYGSSALILTKQPIDGEAFANRLKKDGVPTMQNDQSRRYYFNTLQDQYFKGSTIENGQLINHRQPMLLYVGGISALLILLIACFNYINLNFSRLLQQVRMVHVQKLMGAGAGEINRQLFTDTFLTVLIAFLLSLLIMHDLLPLFNSIVSGRLHAAFFLDRQVLPVVCGLILLLSVIPAFYMSRKIAKLSNSGYRAFFTGNKKQRIISVLSVMQYTISIGLIIATLTVNSQIRFIQKGGSHYKNLIEIAEAKEGDSNLQSLAEELKNLPDVRSVSPAGSSILHGWIIQMVVKDAKGQDTYFSQIHYSGGPDLLDALQIKLIKGIAPEKAVALYPQPVYVNEKYAEILIPAGEDPVGKPQSTYETGKVSTIAGIIENTYTQTLEREVCPIVIKIDNNLTSNFSHLYIRLTDNREKSLAAVRKAWQKVHPQSYFTYIDVYAEFMQRNAKSTELSRLLMMYSLISIFLTCFGLFGMTLYSIGQRTKEIGIRKVNGARTLQIMLLLNRQFVGWIALAFLIASPACYLWLSYYLEGYLYRVEIQAGHFFLAGGIVLAITLLTVSWHSYKAASGNPVDSLKAE